MGISSSSGATGVTQTFDQKNSAAPASGKYGGFGSEDIKNMGYKPGYFNAPYDPYVKQEAPQPKKEKAKQEVEKDISTKKDKKKKKRKASSSSEEDSSSDDDSSSSEEEEEEVEVKKKKAGSSKKDKKGFGLESVPKGRKLNEEAPTSTA